MVMKDCLEKNVQKKVLIEKHREYYLVLDEETGAIFLVNETSHFLYENCDGQSVESLCELLFDQCIDKDQLDKRTVYYRNKEECAMETLSVLPDGRIALCKMVHGTEITLVFQAKECPETLNKVTSQIMAAYAERKEKYGKTSKSGRK